MEHRLNFTESPRGFIRKGKVHLSEDALLDIIEEGGVHNFMRRRRQA